jgi:hypothetical protein
MGRCPYYVEKRELVRSREIFSHGQDGSSTQVVKRHCAHKHSPVSEGVLFGATLLRCGGDLEKCQVPIEKRADAV